MAGFNLKYDVRESAPTIARFHRSNHPFRIICGPIGGGKSVACCIEIFRRCQEQVIGPDGFRRSRWAVVRNCYDDQTEILTEKRGWVLFKDLNPEDKVATRVDGKLTFEAPSYYHAAPYQGRMVTINSEDMDLCVTPDHELWVSNRYGRQKVWKEHKHIKAQEIEGIGELYRMTSTSEWEGSSTDYSVDWFEFLGFWFAQGYAGIYPRKDCNGEHYRLTLTHRSSDVEYVEELLYRVGLKYGIQPKPGCYDFRVNTEHEDVKEIIREFVTYGKATTKHIPQYVKDAPAEHIQAFLYGYQRGDGMFKKSTKSVDILYSSSLQLINDLHELVVRSGRAASLYMKAEAGTMQLSPEHPSYNTQPSYVLVLRQPKRENPIIQKKNWGALQYDGMVYCVTVSSHVVLVRRNGKAIWCGQTRSQLKDTTLKTWFDWMPPGTGIGRWTVTDATYYLEFGDVKAEILFRALDTPEDVSKVLSLELTGAWLNECREIPQEIVESLQGRLKRYPARERGGSNYWMLIADTNPPAEETYWWRLMEHMPLDGTDEDTIADCDVFHQPSGISPEAENLRFLAPGYYTSLAKGRSKAWIDVYIHAKYAISQSGKPVYHDCFIKDKHVSKTTLFADPLLPVVVGIDAGLTPAASFRQMQNDGRVFVLREAVEFDMGMKRFAKSRLRPIIKNYFPHNPIIFTMDPSSKKRSDGDEEVTAFRKLKAEFSEESNVTVKLARTNNLGPRIQATEEALSQFPKGEPLLLIDPSCVWTIQGLQTKYHYPKRNMSGDYDDSPKKNEWSHIIEAGQYADLFLLSPKYDAAEYMSNYSSSPLFPQRSYRPAQAEGY